MSLQHGWCALHRRAGVGSLYRSRGGRFVFGGITLIAWQGDLEGGGRRPEGVNYWLPPFTAIPLMGEQAACSEVCRSPGAGRAAGCGQGPGVSNDAGCHDGAALHAHRRAGARRVVLQEITAQRLEGRAALAAREAITSQLAEPAFITRALLQIGLTSGLISLATLMLPLLTPFDLERYLKSHYSKTREQTLDLLELFVKDGIKRGLPVDAIQDLLAGLHAPS